MEIPLELFSLFIIISIALAGIGLWRKIPMLMFLGGFFIAFWSIQTDTIITDSFASGLTDNLYHYNIESATGNINLNNGGVTIRTEFVSASNSQLVGDTINCIDAYFGKTGSPTGNVQYGTFDSTTGALIIDFGTIDLSAIMSAQEWHTSCLTGTNTYTIQNGDRIGIMYNGGDGSNFISQRSNGNNPFDGTITFLSSWTSPTWTSATGNDPTMRFYLSGGDFEITNNNFVFDGYAKVMFIVFGAIMLLAGAIVWKLD